MEIYEKRGRWCLRDTSGVLRKFATEEEAKHFAGWVPPVEETLDGSKEKEKSSTKKASTDKQTTVRVSKSPSKKEV